MRSLNQVPQETPNFSSQKQVLEELARIGVGISQRTLSYWIEDFKSFFPSFFEKVKTGKTYETRTSYYQEDHIEWLKIAATEFTFHTVDKQKSKRQVIKDLIDHDILVPGAKLEMENLNTSLVDIQATQSTPHETSGQITKLVPPRITVVEPEPEPIQTVSYTQVIQGAITDKFRDHIDRYYAAEDAIELHNHLCRWAAIPDFAIALEDIEKLLGGQLSHADRIPFRNFTFYRLKDYDDAYMLERGMVKKPQLMLVEEESEPEILEGEGMTSGSLAIAFDAEPA